MANIPTISAPAVVRAPYAGQEMSLDAALAPLRGAQSIAKGVGQPGQVAQEFAVRAAKIWEDGILAEQQRAQEAAFGAFQADLANMPDPDTWTAEWKKRSAALEKDISGRQQKLGPDGKRRSTELFKNWQLENSIRVNTQSRVEVVREAKRSVEASALEKAQRGDIAGAYADIDRLDKEHNALSDTEIVEWKKKVLEEGEKAEIERDIQRDPSETRYNLENGYWKSLTPEARNHYINRSRIQEEHNREETGRQLDREVFDVEEGRGSPVTAEQHIREAEESKRIDPSQARTLLGRLGKNANPAEMGALSAQKWDEALALDLNDPQYRLRKQTILAEISHLPSSLQKSVIDVFNDKESPDPGKKDVAVEAIGLIDDSYKQGFFGKHEIKPVYLAEMEPEMIDAPGLFTGDIKNPRFGKAKIDKKTGQEILILDKQGQKQLDERRTAARTQEVMENEIWVNWAKRKVYDWAKANPDKTPAEQVAYANSLIAQRKDVALAQRMVNGLMGTPSDADSN